MYFWNNAFDVEQPSHYLTFKAHTPRVKRIKHIVIGEKNYLISCSTDGTICTWEIDEILANIESIAETKTMEEDLKPLYSLYSYQRIITLDAHFADQITNPLSQPNAQAGNHENQQQQQEQNKEKQQQHQGQKNQKKGDKKNTAEKQGKKIKKVQFAELEQEKPKKQAEKKKMFSKEKVIQNQLKYQQKAQQHGNQKKQFGKKSNKDLGSGSKKRFGQKKLEVEYDD